jgi:hypothetical protein
MKEQSAKRTTTPEEEGIELLPDAMERLERAAKAVFAHPPIAKDAIKGARRQPPAKPKRRRS